MLRNFHNLCNRGFHNSANKSIRAHFTTLDKELYIDADNSEQQYLLAKQKYVRPYPEHEQPSIQELLAQMNETDVRMFKFIDDSGLYSHESLLGLLDLEKRAIKQNKQNKNGKLKLTKISEEEREKLEIGDIVFARWIVQERVLARDPLIKAFTVTVQGRTRSRIIIRMQCFIHLSSLKK